MTISDVARANRLLAVLPKGALEERSARLRLVRFRRQETVLHPTQVVDAIYFPISGLTSLVVLDREGATVEVATVGREGLVGGGSLLAHARQPTEAVQQVAGRAVQMASADFNQLIDEVPAFQDAIVRYLNARYVEVAQTAACDHLHPIGARAARWLLTTRDRLGSDSFPMTHELLATMVSASRPRVSVALEALSRVGAVRYDRGRMVIGNAVELEALACECYQIVRDAMAAAATASTPDPGRAPGLAVARSRA